MLYVIPTPLGNLQDISERSKTILAAVDFIIAENPRYTAQLLQKLNLPKKEILQFAEHNEERALDVIIPRLLDSEASAALVSDAGMPAIADPGFRLVRACVKEQITVDVLPGPNAAITALAGSGLPTDKFWFIGFLPKTKPKLGELLDQGKHLNSTLIAYESPHRILKTLTLVQDFDSGTQCVVARELTKLHQEYVRGSVSEVLRQLSKRQSIKGEIVLLLAWK